MYMCILLGHSSRSNLYIDLAKRKQKKTEKRKKKENRNKAHQLFRRPNTITEKNFDPNYLLVSR